LFGPIGVHGDGEIPEDPNLESGELDFGYACLEWKGMAIWGFALGVLASLVADSTSGAVLGWGYVERG